MFTSLAAFAAAAALVLCLVVCGELFEKPDTLCHAALMMTDLDKKAAEVIVEVERQKAEREEAGP